MTASPAPPSPTPPPASPDADPDSSVAGEEDPGAALDEPDDPPPAHGPAPGPM